MHIGDNKLSSIIAHYATMDVQHDPMGNSDMTSIIADYATMDLQSDAKECLPFFETFPAPLDVAIVNEVKEETTYPLSDKIMPLNKYLGLGLKEAVPSDKKQLGPYCAFREGQHLLAMFARNGNFAGCHVGVIKDTKDCGTTSVSNGVAILWAKQQANLQPNDAVMIHNGGGGGFKFDIYAPKLVNGVIVGMVRVSDVKITDAPTLSHLIAAPTEETQAEYDLQERKMKAYSTQADECIARYADQYVVREVLVFATGPLRGAYYKAHIFDRMGMLQRFGELCCYLGHEVDEGEDIDINPDRNLWIMEQDQESYFEDIAIRGMYENLSRAGQVPPNIDIVFTGGAGTTTSQLSTGNLPYGMTYFVEQFAITNDFTHLADHVALQEDDDDIAEQLEHKVSDARQANKIPVFALKSGFVLAVPSE